MYMIMKKIIMKSEFTLAYFDTEKYGKKAQLMNALELMFSDEDNVIPDSWYMFTDYLMPNSKVKITVELIEGGFCDRV